METPDDGVDYIYGRTWFTPITETLTFALKACHDGHILLTAIPGYYQADDAYEIILGGNTNTETYIRRGYKVCYKLDHVDIAFNQNSFHYIHPLFSFTYYHPL